MAQLQTFALSIFFYCLLALTVFVKAVAHCYVGLEIAITTKPVPN